MGRLAAIALVLASAALVAACGGAAKVAKPPASALHGQVIDLAANPGGDLRFDKTSLHAHPGTVTIVFTNRSPVVHNVTVANASGVVGATPTFDSGEKTLTLKLSAGSYTFYCSVPGHEAAGMKGTLVVG